jgi:hypothetical protein
MSMVPLAHPDSKNFLSNNYKKNMKSNNMHRLPASVFEVSNKMLNTASRNPVAASAVREAGWLLLASLVASMPKEVEPGLVLLKFNFYIILRTSLSDFNIVDLAI